MSSRADSGRPTGAKESSQDCVEPFGRGRSTIEGRASMLLAMH
ncbi:hypothetical protein NC653_013857 [Populus alba x Populus x berolinensis]|uniref:Uncharacterized protein n=1 Tax=Populus alba x Populus x berolinensis TaxID=444605 RepID=A0AAD6W421_9ROSI|nr:hypothetical protein NC653_013856 [Populus alba x Populus x berolinensis]KAJ6997414.1 hypothetical protein NC653_013857 [Populus alba x Populus x berolinensis]